MIDHWLNKLELRQLYLSIGGIAFLGLTALVMFGAKPIFERHTQTSWEIETLSELKDDNTALLLAPLEQEVAKMEHQLLGELQNIPVRQLESHIIAALQNSAWQADVNLVSIEPLEHTAELPYQEIAFRLELEGKYFNLDDWIHSVSTQLGYVVFKEYSVRVEKEGEDPTLSAKVLMAAYRVGDVQ